jgi:ketosteroid isomerase-like protein
MEITIPAAVRTYITASNAFDADAVMAAFADDAVVNDTRIVHNQPTPNWANV